MPEPGERLTAAHPGDPSPSSRRPWRWLAVRALLIVALLIAFVYTERRHALTEGFSTPDVTVTVHAVATPAAAPSDLAAVLAAVADGRATPLTRAITQLPRTPGPAWALVTLSAAGAEPIERVVYLREYIFERVEFRVEDRTGRWLPIDLHAPPGLEAEPASAGGHAHGVRLRLEPGHPVRLLVGIDTPGLRRLPLAVVDPRTFRSREPVRMLALGFALGLPLAVAGWAASAWLSSRRRLRTSVAGGPADVLYLLIVLCGVVVIAWYSGLGRSLLTDLPPVAARAMGYVALQAITGLSLLHAWYFLDLAQHLPRPCRWLRRAGWALLAIAPFTLLAGWQAAETFLVWSGLFASLLVLCAATVCVVRGVPHARLYWWATTILPACMLLVHLSRNDLVRGARLQELLFVAAPLPLLLLAVAAVRRHDDRMLDSERRAMLAEAARGAQRRDFQRRSQLLAASSHDLSHPLQALAMDVQSLQETAGQGARDGLERIQRSIQEVRSLLDSLIVALRSDAADIRPQFSVFAVNDTIRRLVLRYRPLAAHKGLSIRWVASHARVRSDPNLLSRIVENLLVNAIRHTDQGSILLGCRWVHGGNRLRICVIDTGPGLAPVLARRWLEAAPARSAPVDAPGRGPAHASDDAPADAPYGPDPVRADADGGHGLGLMVVKQLADLLGHSVGVRSARDHGSTLWVELERI